MRRPDHAAGRVPRPGAGQPPGRGVRAGRRTDRFRPTPARIRMERRPGLNPDSPKLPGRVSELSPACGSVPPPDRRLTTGCSGPSSPGYRPGAIYDGAPEGSRDSLAELDFNGGSVAARGSGHSTAGAHGSGRGRCPGRRRQGDAGGTVSVLKGARLKGQRCERLGRQVVCLRRAARPAFVQGCRLALLHPAVRRRRGARRRAGGAAGRRSRMRRRSGEREGVRVRVHDLGASGGSR